MGIGRCRVVGGILGADGLGAGCRVDTGSEFADFTGATTLVLGSDPLLTGKGAGVARALVMAARNGGTPASGDGVAGASPVVGPAFRHRGARRAGVRGPAAAAPRGADGGGDGRCDGHRLDGEPEPAVQRRAGEGRPAALDQGSESRRAGTGTRGARRADAGARPAGSGGQRGPSVPGHGGALPGDDRAPGRSVERHGACEAPTAYALPGDGRARERSAGRRAFGAETGGRTGHALDEPDLGSDIVVSPLPAGDAGRRDGGPAGRRLRDDRVALDPAPDGHLRRSHACLDPGRAPQRQPG